MIVYNHLVRPRMILNELVYNVMQITMNISRWKTRKSYRNIATYIQHCCLSINQDSCGPRKRGASNTMSILTGRTSCNFHAHACTVCLMRMVPNLLWTTQGKPHLKKIPLTIPKIQAIKLLKNILCFLSHTQKNQVYNSQTRSPIRLKFRKFIGV